MHEGGRMPNPSVIKLLGCGGIGGKASGLSSISSMVSRFQGDGSSNIRIFVPAFTVITTEFFDDFIQRNDLAKYADSSESDERIALAFQKGEISPRLAGDLWSFVSEAHEPIAVRSSSLLEDALSSPLAGIYQTKMIPNNQPSNEMRFRKLMEAVKFVWSSTYFEAAREFHRGLGRSVSEESMAVMLQDIVGKRYSDRFYPVISGVGKSFNYYAFGRSKPDDGVVSLALGLGKSIVDGSACWSYNPALPAIPPPFGSIRELMNSTQTLFWAVNMGRQLDYDPIKETEYMISCRMVDAHYDDTLRFTASTYDPASDRLVHGVSREGPRILDFAPVLQDDLLPLNQTILALLSGCAEQTGSPVEIEFAMTGPTFDSDSAIGLVQVREMAGVEGEVQVDGASLSEKKALARSAGSLGNGVIDLDHVVYLRPAEFSASRTREIAVEIATVNRELAASGINYLLIGFGRWGSTDPWLGVPVTWGHISGARAILEVSGENMRVELSQGSHFFHNLSSFGVAYISVNEALDGPVDWEWLESQIESPVETRHVRCVKIPKGLSVQIDGRTGYGAVLI